MNSRSAHRTAGPLIPGVLIACLCCRFFFASPAGAFTFSVEASAGYDSNPTLTETSEGSGFSVYGAGVEKAFFLSDFLVVDAHLDGFYQDYWDVEDNYRGRAGTALICPLLGGRLLPSIVGALAAYRDGLFEADERNEAIAGIELSLILSKRVTLGLEQTWNWQDYLNPSKLFAGRGQGRAPQGFPRPDFLFSDGLQADEKAGPGEGAGLGSGDNTGPWEMVLEETFPARNNLLMTTGLDMHVFLTPALTGLVRAAYVNLDSSVDIESYRQFQAEAFLVWEPAEEWRMEAGARWFRTDYHNVREASTRIRKTNDTRSISLQLSRFWGALELFGLVRFESGDFPFYYESYTQQVGQCGLSWSF